MQDRELCVRANQLGNMYRKEKLRFLRPQRNSAKLAVEVKRPFSTAELDALKKAVCIMHMHGVTNYQQFIKSQVVGLRFVNDGKGIFPAITQLCTDAAETRLLNYLQSVLDENGDVVEVEVTDEEKKIPLNSNIKYLSARDRIKTGEASREDCVYVMQLQGARRGRVESYVTDYLKKLNESES